MVIGKPVIIHLQLYQLIHCLFNILKIIFILLYFYIKLFKLPDTMQTEAGRGEAHRRAALMQEFLDNLRAEILL